MWIYCHALSHSLYQNVDDAIIPFYLPKVVRSRPHICTGETHLVQARPNIRISHSKVHMIIHAVIWAPSDNTVYWFVAIYRFILKFKIHICVWPYKQLLLLISRKLVGSWTMQISLKSKRRNPGQHDIMSELNTIMEFLCRCIAYS